MQQVCSSDSHTPLRSSKHVNNGLRWLKAATRKIWGISPCTTSRSPPSTEPLHAPSRCIEQAQAGWARLAKAHSSNTSTNSVVSRPSAASPRARREIGRIHRKPCHLRLQQAFTPPKHCVRADEPDARRRVRAERANATPCAHAESNTWPWTTAARSPSASCGRAGWVGREHSARAAGVVPTSDCEALAAPRPALLLESAGDVRQHLDDVAIINHAYQCVV